MPTDSGTDANVATNTADTQQTTEPTTEQTTQQSTPQSFKVKHLHEEKEVLFSEAPTYIQKGMDYDRVKAKYEDSKPVISFVERLAQQNGMAVPEYLKAVEEYERQQEIEALAQQRSLDPEMAEELYLLRKDRQERELQRQEAEKQAKQNQEYIDFMNQFPDVKPESIPVEVWHMKANNPGISLTDAYIRHEYNSLKSKVQAVETNTKNAEASTGSLTGNGSTSSDFIDSATFEKNKDDRRWVMQNLSKIMKSRANW